MTTTPDRAAVDAAVSALTGFVEGWHAWGNADVIECTLLGGIDRPLTLTHLDAVLAELKRQQAEQLQDNGVRAADLGAEIATTERITSLLYDLDTRTRERDDARELARVSLDILRNVSDEPIRELYGVDDMEEMPEWFTRYGKPSVAALETRDAKSGEQR